MKFDIKDVKSWANRHDVKIGDKGYVANSISQFRELNFGDAKCGKVTYIDDNWHLCFKSDLDRLTYSAFFLPLKAVKKEKKYRPLKSIDEMDCLFNHSAMNANSFITYRSKVTGKIYIELLFAVCRDKNDVLRSINNIPVQDLFDNFEVRKNGKWVPFGVEVTEK